MTGAKLEVRKLDRPALGGDNALLCSRGASCEGAGQVTLGPAEDALARASTSLFSDIRGEVPVASWPRLSLSAPIAKSW